MLELVSKADISGNGDGIIGTGNIVGSLIGGFHFTFGEHNILAIELNLKGTKRSTPTEVEAHFVADIGESGDLGFFGDGGFFEEEATAEFVATGHDVFGTQADAGGVFPIEDKGTFLGGNQRMRIFEFDFHLVQTIPHGVGIIQG